ncbi:MAG: hypothetical protein ACFE7R_11280, partial [Candidatus Hodarchaeota archaeon]
IFVEVSRPFYIETNCSIEVDVLTLTVMTILGSQYVEISPGGSCEAKVRYMFLDGVGIEDATVSVLSWSGPEDGLEYEDAEQVPYEPGNYSIVFTAELAGTYYITIAGDKEDHGPAAVSFFLIVGAISTEVDEIGIGPPDLLYYNQTYSFSLFYKTGGDIGIEGAVVNETYNPASVIECADAGNGIYNFTIRVPEVGSHTINLRFFKIGYAPVDYSFNFHVTEVPTTCDCIGIQESYYMGRNYEFAFFLNSSLVGSIEGASIIIPIQIREFFTPIGTGLGWYNYTLRPLEGEWNVTIWILRTGFQGQTYEFTLRVHKIPLVISPEYPLNQTYSRLEGTILHIQIQLLAEDIGEVVSGASVKFELIDANQADGNIIDSGVFLESQGFYYANVTVPMEGLYLIRITISKENYAIAAYEVVLNSEVDPQAQLIRIVGAGLIGAILLLLVLVSIAVGRRYYISYSTNRYLTLLALKERIEDAKNLIGILVIHRRIGLPVYSRIIKGAFEESMLSSFITAISQFRAEFSWSEPVWTAIPITEVVTAVQTQHLICAMINVEHASSRQKEQLELFAMEIGELYDGEEETIQKMFHTTEVGEAFLQGMDPIFDSYFDGPLMNKYVGAKKDLPKELKPIDDVFDIMDIGSGVNPDAIVKALVVSGHSELDAHKMLFQALDDNHLISAGHPLPKLIGDE